VPDVGHGGTDALIETVNSVPQVAPGLLAWLEGAADWEQNRRRGLDFPLLPPEAAIPPEEDAISITTAAMLRAMFAQDDRPETRGVMALLDAVVILLTGGEQRHLARNLRQPRRPMARSESGAAVGVVEGSVPKLKDEEQ
jgi:hypothetical protein